MLLLLIKLIISLAAIIISADWMTSGASVVAIKMKIRPFIVGLTIVAMGTSAPELFVSVSSALKSSASPESIGMGDIAIGNVVGSNIFNNLMIVGCVALMVPLAVRKTTVKRDLPIVTLSSLLLLFFLLDGNLARLESYALLISFIIYMWWTVRAAKKDTTGDAGNDANKKQKPLWMALVLIAVGLAGLIVASEYFVTSAAGIATELSVSEKIVGLTIVGAGTSAPELATSIMAARKGQGEMAIGNVIGSNIFNILMILGLTGLIHPLHGLTVNYIDLGVMTVAAILFWLFSFTKYTLERWEGAVLLILCGGYMSWLIIGS